jgi:PhnB protein
VITINAFLPFNGNCLDAFNHYQKVFGGDLAAKQMFKDEPGSNHVNDKFGIQWMVSFSGN